MVRVELGHLELGSWGVGSSGVGELWVCGVVGLWNGRRAALWACGVMGRMGVIVSAQRSGRFGGERGGSAAWRRRAAVVVTGP